MASFSAALMFGFLFSRQTLDLVLSNPFFLILVAFWVWMFVDAIRRQEWFWAVLIAFFQLSAVFYFFFVYRPNRNVAAGPAFEFPGATDRKRIKELEDQIHHLDKAHHHAELGEIYLRQGKVDKATECFTAARERDPDDIDILALVGKGHLEKEEFEAARTVLERVVAEDVRHDYGQTQLALAEVYSRLGEREKAIAAWQSVLEANTYAQARVMLGEALLAEGRTEEACEQLDEVIEDSKHTPDFHRRKDKYWVRRARQLLGKSGRS